MDFGLGNGPRIELGVRRRRGFILEAKVEMDQDTSRKPRAKVVAGPRIVARPAPFAYERRRDEEDATELPRWRVLGESIDQDCSADRVPDENRAVVERRQLSFKRRFPRDVAGVLFIRHPRISDFVIR